MRKLAFAIFAVATIGCAHAIRNFADCGTVEAADRNVECRACTLQNKAGGILGTYEYRPGAADGQRCVRVD